jgi:hypothetical protein
MDLFNRIVATVLWLVLLVAICLFAVMPHQSLLWIGERVDTVAAGLTDWKSTAPTNFVVAQAATFVTAFLVLGTLIGMEVLSGRRRGVKVRTSAGSAVELDTDSIARRLSWQLDQLAEVVSVVPSVKAKGTTVDVRLEVETAPDVDVPMKTDEVVAVAREIIEQDMGIKLGKLDVHVRYAPYDPDWA